jgi:hypothetical protein
MRLRAMLLGMLVLSAAGCLNDRPVKSTSLIDRALGMVGPTGPDAVFVEYALIERPAGSAGINREVWANIDEQFLPTETRQILCENGLRAGIVGGLLPAELGEMIANPKSGIGHRQRRLYVDNAAVLTVNGPTPRVEYQMRATMAEEPVTRRYEQAKFSINIVPTFASEGRITLKCVPEVESQDPKSWLPTGATGPGWLGNRPVDRCESLAWEAALSPGEFLVIGAHYDRGPWLGNQIFGGMQGNEKVQRLLIVRAGRLAETGQSAVAPTSKDGVVPLAAQASTSAVRGQRP